MSQAVGPLAVLFGDGRGPYLPGVPEISEHTRRLIDEEVHRIVEEAHQQVVPLLEQNRDKLDSLSQALLKHETLDEDQAYAAAKVKRAATEIDEPAASLP
jgi:cell division protease FtsH